MKTNLRARLVVCIALAVVLIAAFAQASSPTRSAAEWSFVQRSRLTQELPVRIAIESGSPERVAAATGIPKVVRHPAAGSKLAISNELRANLMRPLDQGKARIAVDLEHSAVIVRRGESQTVLPIEHRNRGSATAQRIAEVAQAGTSDPWLVPHSIVVDGEHIGIRMRDGETILDPSYLEPDLRRITEIEVPPSTVALR